jgi:hypothetical protein
MIKNLIYNIINFIKSISIYQRIDMPKGDAWERANIMMNNAFSEAFQTVKNDIDNDIKNNYKI